MAAASCGPEAVLTVHLSMRDAFLLHHAGKVAIAPMGF
jgi:hypothetical protein